MKRFALLISAALMVISSACANKKSQETTTNKENNTELSSSEAEHSNYIVKSIDSKIKGADILPAIIKDYEGKVVLIDFWATWCGPCRAAMKQLDTIKPQLQEKGVVFLYITGETSPLNKWNTMIENISGDHYRLTDSQWNDLCTQLSIPGIPAYMLLNKDGSVAYSNLDTGGYPGSDILQNNIEVALTK